MESYKYSTQGLPKFMPFYNIKYIHFIPIAIELLLQHQLKKLKSTVSSYTSETQGMVHS